MLVITAAEVTQQLAVVTKQLHVYTYIHTVYSIYKKIDFIGYYTFIYDKRRLCDEMIFEGKINNNNKVFLEMFKLCGGSHSLNGKDF